MVMLSGILVLTLGSTLLLRSCQGHGYMSEPPCRSSMWRFGYNTSHNYADNQLFCGGFHTQWSEHDGKCGVCGDNYGSTRPRDNENGGVFGQGIVVRRYRRGQVISVLVILSANHHGWFEFSVCRLETPDQLEEEECFVLLPLWGTQVSRFNLTSSAASRYMVRLQLPANLECKRCVLRWHYNTGNFWGRCEDGTSALGCGAQENFRCCADISIQG